MMRFKFAVSALAIVATIATPALALKYAKREHQIAADKTLPVWVPGKVDVQPAPLRGDQ